MPLCGGTSDVKPVDDEAKESILQVKSAVEEKLGAKVDKFEPLSMKTQVVAGINYFVKVDIGSEIIHLRIYRDLQKNVSLHSLQRGKQKEEDIGYF